MIYTDVFCKTSEAVAKAYRFVSSCGGTRSGKTISILQLLFLIVSQDSTPTINSVVSETMPHLKRGAIRDFQTCIDLYDDECWSKGTSTYTFPNGAIIEFFSADSPAKVHGPARDRLFINEGQNIEWEIVRQLLVRTRGLVLIDYNPTHEFWANKQIETRAECVRIHSTYLDNRDHITHKSMLSDEQIREIESNRNDANWWRVYGEGKVGQLEGLIFPDFEQIDSLPEGLIDVGGMDFGFTNDPSVFVRAKIDTARKGIYLDEVFYRKGMLNADMATAMKDEGIPMRGWPIFADCAEPKTIAELSGYGYNVKPCYKAARKAEQLQAMKGYRIYVTKRSLNLIREMREYTWQKDKDGNSINEPIAVNDHAMDAARYAVCTWLYENQNKGNYHISFRR